MENSGQASSSSGPLVPKDHDLFDKVFTNDVVWNKVGSYLNQDDLKDCRLTCQLFNTKIMDLKTFKDRARLDVPLSKFPALDWGNTRVKWRHLAINFDFGLDIKNPENRSDPLSDLPELLSSIISLKLYRTDYESFETGLSPEVPKTLFTIFPMLTNIQEISMDLKIFERVNLHWFAKASVALMSKVKEFHLEYNDKDEDVPDKVMRCSMGLPLASVQLEVLRVDAFDWKELDFYSAEPLFRILRQNQKHLKSFQVKDPKLWTNRSADEFGTLPKFPQLKVLQLKVVTEEGRGAFFGEAHLIEFFNNQPESLEEIDLEFVGPIPSTVFRILKYRALNLNLKVLRIKMSGFATTQLSDMEQWNFLKETNLQEFSFQLKTRPVRLSNEQLKDFFGTLPKSVKKLSIEGVMATSGQPNFNLEVSKCFDPKVLTHLNLRGCTGLLNDAALQDFWKTLKNLRLLDLSEGGDNCTDWGFTGVPAGFRPQGVSIAWLKGLKSLTLQSCDGPTDRTLIDGIKFPELQFLDLMGNLQFTKIGFLAVISQNPSLQTLVTEHDHETHEDLLTHIDYPRRIRSLKINSRLTRELSLDSDCELCDKCLFDESSDDSGPGKQSPSPMVPPLEGAGGDDGMEVKYDKVDFLDLH